MEISSKLGVMLVVVMGLFVGLALISPIAKNVEATRISISVVNYSFAPPIAGSSVDLPGQELVSYSAVKNGSAVGEDIPASNYTIAEGVSPRTGLKRIIYTANAGNFTGGKETALWITYTYNPEGYADDSGARSLIGIITLFACLAIATIAMVPGIRDVISEWGRG